MQDSHKGSRPDLARWISAEVWGMFPYTRAHKRPISGAIEARKRYVWAVLSGSLERRQARRSVRYGVSDDRGVRARRRGKQKHDSQQYRPHRDAIWARAGRVVGPASPALAGGGASRLIGG